MVEIANRDRAIWPIAPMEAIRQRSGLGGCGPMNAVRWMQSGGCSPVDAVRWNTVRPCRQTAAHTYITITLLRDPRAPSSFWMP